MTFSLLLYVLLHTCGGGKMLACDYFLAGENKIISVKSRLVVVAFGHVIPLWEESSWKSTKSTLWEI